MQKHTTLKSTLNRYYIECITVILTFLISTVMLNILWSSVWAVIIAVLALAATIVLLDFLQYKRLHSVLLEDLNSKKYSALLTQGKFLNLTAKHRINAALFSGDYITVINICVGLLEQKCSIKSKCYYLTAIARCYFELGDIQKLEAVCDKYEDYVKNYKYGYLIQRRNFIMRYFRYYLKGKFNACKILCNEQEATRNPKAANRNITKLYNAFYYASACHAGKDNETAKQLFEKIVRVAPNMNIAALSKAYSEQNEDGLKNTAEEILPNRYYNISKIKFAKICRVAVNAVISAALIVLFIVRMAVGNEVEGPSNQSKPTTFSDKLKAAITAEYASCKEFEYFNLEVDGKVTDAVYILKQPDESIDVGLIVTEDEGKTLKLIVGIENVDLDEYYYMKSQTGEHFIGFEVYEYKSELPDENYKTVEMEIDGSRKWICFDSIAH